MKRLVTLAEYLKMSPYDQGYIVYMQAEWPESELKGQTNPNPKASRLWREWRDGSVAAMLETIDSEE